MLVFVLNQCQNNFGLIWQFPLTSPGHWINWLFCIFHWLVLSFKIGNKVASDEAGRFVWKVQGISNISDQFAQPKKIGKMLKMSNTTQSTCKPFKAISHQYVNAKSSHDPSWKFISKLSRILAFSFQQNADRATWYNATGYTYSHTATILYSTWRKPRSCRSSLRFVQTFRSTKQPKWNNKLGDLQGQVRICKEVLDTLINISKD